MKSIYTAIVGGNKISSEFRFYPDFFAFLEGEPMKEKFEIINDIRFGKCIRSHGYFKKGELVALIHAKIVVKTARLHSVQINSFEHVYDPWFAGLISHSCEPNIAFDKAILGFYATQEIRPGVILTQDYELTEDDLYQKFYCKCGSPCCRGKIQGKSFLQISSNKKKWIN